MLANFGKTSRNRDSLLDIKTNLPDVVLLQPIDLALVLLLLLEVVPLQLVKLCHQLFPLLSKLQNWQIMSCSLCCLAVWIKKMANHQLLPLLPEFKNWQISSDTPFAVYIKIGKSSAAPSAVYIKIGKSSAAPSAVYIKIGKSSAAPSAVYIKIGKSSAAPSAVYIKIGKLSAAPSAVYIKIGKSSAAPSAVGIKNLANHQLLPLLSEFKKCLIISCSLCCLSYKIGKPSAAPSVVYCKSETSKSFWCT